MRLPFRNVRHIPPIPGFTIIFPPWIGHHEADHHEAFPYLRGMVTLALTEQGWEVEGEGVDWAHWVNGGKKIYVRGFGPPENRRIPFNGQGGVTQDELDVLAARLIEASGWVLERGHS
jgi:hypothetical protein